VNLTEQTDVFIVSLSDWCSDVDAEIDAVDSVPVRIHADKEETLQIALEIVLHFL
jgi:hypothetical protein